MLIILPISPPDQALALKLAEWMVDLGPYHGHSLLLVADDRCAAIESVLTRMLAPHFAKVDVIGLRDQWNKWPESPNAMFAAAARHIESRRLAPYWLWIEADAVPMRAGWVEELEAAHIAGKRAFTGDFVHVTDPPDVPDHMSGIAIYPGNMSARAGLALISTEIAWDVEAAPQILPQLNATRLIQHNWKHPRFESLEQARVEIRPDCVLFHADKSGSLIDLLRAETLPTAARSPEPIAVSTGEIVPDANAIGGQLVNTYFEPLPDIPADNERRLIQKWADSWSKFGWGTRVLTEADAKAHPLYAVANSVFSRPAAYCPAGYNRACLMRWLAMAQIGGGWLSDYDVMNYGVEPSVKPHSTSADVILFNDGRTPCLVCGNANGYGEATSRFIVKLMEQSAIPHDQQLIQDFQIGVVSDTLRVVQYGSKGWEDSTLVHYNNESLRGKGIRFEAIAKIEDELPPAEQPGDAEEWPKPISAPESIIPWASIKESEDDIRRLALELKKYCGAPRRVSRVRQLLAMARVIAPERVKKRKRRK